jgi:hypothetical protein
MAFTSKVSNRSRGQARMIRKATTDRESKGRTNYNSRAAEAIALTNPGAAVPRAEYPLELFY